MNDDNNNLNPEDSKNDFINRNGDGGDLHVGLKILSFCIPLAGAILYFVKKENEPIAAKSACTMALWGVGVGIALNVLLTVMGVGM